MSVLLLYEVAAMTPGFWRGYRYALLFGIPMWIAFGVGLWVGGSR